MNNIDMGKGNLSEDFKEMQQKLENLTEEIEKCKAQTMEANKAMRQLDEILEAMNNQSIRYRDETDKKQPCSWER